MEDLGRVQPLFGVIGAVEEGRDVQVDGRDGTGMAVGVDGLGLPEVVFGDPESVAFRAVGRRRGAGGHLGAAVFAQSVVAQALGDRTDGDAEVAVAQQGSVREFSRGHQNGRCMEDSGVSGHLTQGFSADVGRGRVAPRGRGCQQQPEDQTPDARTMGWGGKGWHGRGSPTGWDRGPAGCNSAPPSRAAALWSVTDLSHPGHFDHP